jgi:hemerythrin
MPLMTWTKEMSVGVKVLDDDHKKLVGMLNRLNEGMLANKGRATLGEIFDELIDYTKTHFTREEGFLLESGYAEVDTHKKQHADLVMRVTDLQRRYNKGELTLTREVLNFLKDWLTYHIKGHDQQYGSHLNAKGIH